jgi:EAL domain-containing protein (putative c-di-GMP-specific phosphodiesterase class I)
MQIRLNAMIKQAEQHDVRVIAACIENANCLQQLWQSGVHYIQGNFLQEPATALDFDFGS